MRNKFFLWLLFLTLFTTFFSGCSKQEAELGNIKDVTIKETSASEKTENLFSAKKNTLGYSFHTYKNPRGYMDIKLPSNWNVIWHSDRHIEVAAPENDPILPGNTMHIYYDFSINDIQQASDMVSIFKDTLYQETYHIQGRSYKQYRYKMPKLRTDTTFTNGHEDKVTIGITENMKMRHGATGSTEQPLAGIDYYVQWVFPCVFSVVVPMEKQDVALELLSYIVSNLSYDKQQLEKTGYTEPVESGIGLKLALPSAFKQIESSPLDCSLAQRTYLAPIDSHTGYSGMSLSTYALTAEDVKNISADTISQSYGAQFFASSFPDEASNFSNLYYAEDSTAIKLAGRTARAYSVDYTLLHTNEGYSKYFVPGDSWGMKVFVVTEQKYAELIVFNYQLSQNDLANEILELLKLYSKVD